MEDILGFEPRFPASKASALTIVLYVLILVESTVLAPVSQGLQPRAILFQLTFLILEGLMGVKPTCFQLQDNAVVRSHFCYSPIYLFIFQYLSAFIIAYVIFLLPTGFAE